MLKQKNIYFFGDKNANGEIYAEGTADMKDILGGKGANLAEMTNLGIPVPPGFTISIEVCDAFYKLRKKYPEGFDKDVQKSLKRLERAQGKRLGDPKDPLLVSVRSGAPVSMPGMMDTILNLGINDRAVNGLSEKTKNPRFAWDAYRRFIQMYGNVVLGIDHAKFEEAIKAIKAEKNIVYDKDLTAEDLECLVDDYKEIVLENTGRDFPQNPIDQLWGAIGAVFGSWNNERAIKYREIENIKNIKGTAVNVQSMVFGNMGEASGTGVCFSRNASTGEKIFDGEYLMNAQGEDVVAGIRTPEKIATLEERNKKIYKQLVKIKNDLEKHFHDMQDIEFTVQEGKLFLLQTRNGKRSGAAAVKIAVDMVKEKLIDKETAIKRITAELLDQVLHPIIKADALKKAVLLTHGIDASPGAGRGRIVFSAYEAEEWNERGERVLLVRQDTSPEDIGGMVASQGILTSTGGRTSHAAVVARQLGTPCICGAKDIAITDKQVVIGEKTFNEGDWITIDGSTGNVYEGQLELVAPEITGEVQTFMSWCDDVRSKSVRNTPTGSIRGFDVRANADLPDQAKRAFDFGAQGVGLCRTEHMFFDKAKLIHFRAMIAADSEEERKTALQKILPLQKSDFYGIFKAMEGRPVIIRLLDPPLHEFVPHTPEEVQELAEYMGVPVETLQPKLDKLKEQNPMLGHRGCRLAVTYPEIYDMQVEAIALAAVECIKEKIQVNPEIMIPIVITARELRLLKPHAQMVLQRVFSEAGIKKPPKVKIGTMIEVPRAAIRAGHIAQYADFFSFGTNDLTQMTFAFSRDDVASFLPSYLKTQEVVDSRGNVKKQPVLDVDPFKSIDEEGVGFLIDYATKAGHGQNPDLKVGICGEHGGDPKTIDFCYRVGLNYVSCSPFRVPLARLAGAQAVIKNRTVVEEFPKTPASKPERKRKATQITQPVTSARKRGRPRINAVKVSQNEVDFVEKNTAVVAGVVKKRGRPAKAVNVNASLVAAVAENVKKRGRKKSEAIQETVVETPIPIKRKRGRPAKNK
ncbi:MAG: pyruvate, phosphate dikinase [Treponema sp.]|jgi:pyruvate,orthophosphate dikinase|nr:pyruvate, phosphate dikinase [Treponema sp.]